MSEASKAKLGELLDGVANMREGVERRQVLSGLLALAAMAQIGRET